MIGISHNPNTAQMPEKKIEVGQVHDAVFQLSQVLQCDLDRRVVGVLLELLEAGVHPESLSDIVNLVGKGKS